MRIRRRLLFTLGLCLFFGCRHTFAQAAALRPIAQPKADDPANAGRKALVDYLNAVAARETAARRATIARITTRAQAEARQRQVRATILRLFGPLPARIPLNPRITGSTTMDGFRVDKVLFDSQPNFPITALLYVPAPPTGAWERTIADAGRFPAIVMAPGHSPAGKAGDVALASAFARAGFIVLSYDPIGQGERLQYPDPEHPSQSLATRPTGEHGEAGLQPTLIGDALARYFLWDGMRAVDYLQSLPVVDPQRIGAFGCSGGGTMTAMLGALDPRVAAIGVACYTTSFDALLPSSTGVQDSEQSTPNFIAVGLDFPDWVELAAPRSYAIIATTEDMFPFAGAQSTEAESRRFYKLFAADDNLAFITGPGHHGNLRPIEPQILAFFAAHLHPDAFYANNLPPITDPFAPNNKLSSRPEAAHLTALAERPAGGPPAPPPPSLTQVTPSGQLSTSYPNIATVFALNQVRAKAIVTPHPKSYTDLQSAIREVTSAKAASTQSHPAIVLDSSHPGASTRENITILSEEGIDLPAFLHRSDTPGKHPAVLRLCEDIAHPYDIEEPRDRAAFFAVAMNKADLLAFSPRPSPAGTEETKSPVLGPFYLTELRSELVGKTLLGMRVDDVIRAVDYLAARSDVDPSDITAEASGHLGLVLLHAAVLDPRLKHITIRNTLANYRSLIDNPLPRDAPQDILPAVLQHYDLPDLVRALGPRLTIAPDAANNP